jgi:hypothetical protein
VLTDNGTLHPEGLGRRLFFFVLHTSKMSLIVGQNCSAKNATQLLAKINNHITLCFLMLFTFQCFIGPPLAKYRIKNLQARRRRLGVMQPPSRNDNPFPGAS